jgi:hypothetical protein
MEIGPMKKRYTEEQIIGFLREADAGLPVKGAAQEAWLQRTELLRLEGQVRRHEGV